MKGMIVVDVDYRSFKINGNQSVAAKQNKFCKFLFWVHLGQAKISPVAK